MKKLFTTLLACIGFVSQSGAQILGQRYIGSSGTTNLAVSTATLSGGNRVIVGSRFVTATNFDAVITCVSATDAVLWTKVISTSANDRFTSVCATSDGGCVAVGFVNQSVSSPYANNEASVYKFDGSGNVLWKKIFKATANGEIFHAVLEVPGSGNIVCAGNYAYGNVNPRGIIANLSSSGTVNWFKSYFSGFYNEFQSIKYLSGKIIGGGFYRTGVGAKWITNIFAVNENNGLQVWNRSYLFASALDPANDGQYTGKMSIIDSNIFVDVYLAGSFATSSVYPALMTIDTTGANPSVFEYPLTGVKFANTISSHVARDKSVILIQQPSASGFDKNFSSSPATGIRESVFTKVQNVRNAAATHVYTKEISTLGTQTIIEGELNGSKLTGVGASLGDLGKNIGALDFYKITVDTSMPEASAVCIQSRSGQRFANLPVVYNPSFNFSAITDVVELTPVDPSVATLSYSSVQTCAFKNMTPDFSAIRTACLKDSFSDLTSTTLKGVQSWFWTFGDGGTSTAKNPSHTYSTFGTYTVKLVVTDSLGDRDSISKTIDIKPYRFLTVPKTAYACQDALPAMVLLNASGGTTYSWTPTSGLSSPSVGNPTATISGPITYVVSSTDSLGCLNIDSTVVSVRSAVVSVEPDSARVCEGADVSLKVKGAITYKWTPSTGLSSDTSSSPVLRVTGTRTYTVMGTDANGCKAADTIIVTAVPAPKVAIAQDSVEICQFSYVELKATGASVYKWSPISPFSVDSVDSVRVRVDSNFYLSVKGWNSEGCAASDSVYLYTKASPAVKIYCDDPTIGCGGETYVDAAGANQYEWWPREYFSDPNGMSSKVNLNRTSFIYLRGTIDNGCTGMDSLEIRFDNESWVQIPNAFTPNGDGRNDYIRPIIVCNFYFLEFAIYNRWGQQVFFDVANNTPWNGTFNGQPCEPGVYYYYVKGKDSGGKLIVLKGDIALIR